MKRLLVAIPDEAGRLVTNLSRMEDLARRINGMHPDVVIEQVEDIAVIVQVPDELESAITHGLGCKVTEFLLPGEQPPAPPPAVGIPNWDVYANPPNRMSDEAFDDMIEDFNRGEGDD